MVGHEVSPHVLVEAQVTWTWNRRHTVHRDKEFVDHVHDLWTIEEGHNNEAAKNGRPWCLLHRGVEIESCKRLIDAKNLADSLGEQSTE